MPHSFKYALVQAVQSKVMKMIKDKVADRMFYSGYTNHTP